MAQGGKSGGTGRRFRTPVVLVMLILGVAGIGALAAVLLSGGSDGDTPQEVVSVPTIEAPDSSGDTESPGAAEDPLKAKKSPPPLPPVVRKAQADAARAAAISAATPTAEEVCPPKASPRQCAELLKILADASRGSDPIARNECPFATKAQCEEAARSYKEAKGKGNPIDFEGGECPLPTQALCEEAGRQAQQQQGN